MKNEVKNIRTLMPRAPKGIVTEKKSLKEEVGYFKDYQFCKDVAQSLEDGIDSGRTTEDIEWSLTIWGSGKDDIDSREDFHSYEFYDEILYNIAYAVKEGHLFYDGLDMIITASMFKDKKDVAYDLIRLFDVDDKDVRKFLSDDEYELEFYFDFSIDYDMDEFDRVYDDNDEDEDFDESLKEDFTYQSSIKEDFDYTNTDAVEEEPNPEPGPDMGVANLLITLINGEWDTIKDYNDFIATISAEGGYDDMLAAIQDIVSEENVHVGQLQKLLQQISPDALKIAQGEQEAQEQIDGEDSQEKIEEPVEPEEK